MLAEIWNSEILVFEDKNLELSINGLISFFLMIVLVILTKGISILFIPKEGLLNISTSNIAVKMGVGQISTNFGTRCRSLNMICIHSYFHVLT